MHILLSFLIILACAATAAGQDATDTGPQLPIVLEWADSLVGSAPGGTTQREFLGHVRFRQGNVTVNCDRAIHDLSANAAELFGNVVVTQDSLTMTAPYARYDGNTFVAVATRGIKVRDGHRTLEARNGEYSTKTHVAIFNDRVYMFDDTAKVWSDRVIYDRDTKHSTATGRVVVNDSVRRAIIAADTVYNDPSSENSIALGNASLWQWEADTVSPDSIRMDTLLVMADTLEAFQGANERFIAQGNVSLVRGTIAARADSMQYRDESGHFDLFGMPMLWADSMQLLADTIAVRAPKRALREVHGINEAIMMSRTDTTVPDRFDQVSGRVVSLFVEQDTVRSLIAVDEARSITFRTEEGVKDGLAKFASDTIKAYFTNGQPEDIYWLGGVQGEHHPEPVVAGNESTYRLPNFEWRLDRPVMWAPPAPYLDRMPRPVRIPRTAGEIQATTGKKK